MAASNDLIMVFIGLEISSIASYILAGYLRDDKGCNESALKYFLLGSFATAFFLYGVAIVYGTTGSVNLVTIRRAALHQAADPVFLAVAAALIFVGVKLVVGEALWLRGAGLLLGVAGSVALRSVVAGHLYGVKLLDPMVMSAVVLTLALVGLATCALPARRATRVDPVIVLREQ